MKLTVKQLLGDPQDITMKDGTVIQKQLFLADDNKTYATFAKVLPGQEYDGEVSNDTRSGELRFKKTKVAFTPRGGGGGESNRQTALKAAATATGPAGVTTTLGYAEDFLKWLEAGQAGSPGQGTVAQPTQTATQAQINPSGASTEDRPPLDSYEGME